MDHKTMKIQFADIYLDFVNNFLTTKGFALYHDISEKQARAIIELGKEFHEERVEHYKVNN